MFDDFILKNTKTGNQVEFNFEEGETPTPTPTGDVSNSTATFTEAQTRANILSGETLSVMFGKIKKFFADLKTVAFTGSYDDLTDKPSLFSGDYNDLTNKPTIPTVNNATLTIKQGETTKGTFTANASTDVEIDLDAGGGGGSSIDTWKANLTIPSGSYVLNSSIYGVSFADDLTNPCLVAENYDAFWSLSYDMFFQTYLERALSGDIGGVGIQSMEKRSMPENAQSVLTYTALAFQTNASGGHYYQMFIVYKGDKFYYYMLDPFGEAPYTTDADLTFDLECLKYIPYQDNTNT